MAGAVAARPGDTGSLWYDPAGLAAIERGRVSANGSVFGLRVRNVPAAVVSRLGGSDVELDLRSTDVIAVPNALAAAFHLGAGVTIGAGLFVTAHDVRTASGQRLDVPLAETPGGTIGGRIDLQSDLTKYHVGLGLGWAPTGSVRLGIAPFVTYRTDSEILQHALGVETPGGNSLELGQATVSRTLVGLTGAAGLQVDAGPAVTLAVVARPPELFLHGSSDGGEVEAAAQTVDGADALLAVGAATDPDSGTSILAPARFTAAVRWASADAVELAAEVEVATPASNPALGIDDGPTLDVRAGGRVALTEEIAVGLGGFTDLAANRKLGTGLMDEVIDWVGGTVGGTLRTPLALATAPDRKDGIVLSTTIAVRYATGFGVARALVIDEVERRPARDVVYHEILPFFGSSILF